MIERLFVDPDDIIDKILRHYIEFKSTWREILSIVSMINEIFGQKVVPDTKYLLLKIFCEKSSAILHFICFKCQRYGFSIPIRTNNKSSTCECGANSENIDRKSAFVSFSLEDAIRQLITSNSDNLILHDKEPDVFPIKDIYNGILYRRVINEAGGKALIFGYNSDGLRRFKCTKSSLWPGYLCLYNLKPSVRLLKDNIIIASLFNGSKIDSRVVMEPLIKEMNEINNCGGIITPFGKCKIFIITGSFDSVAKPKFMMHKQFNGICGCPACIHPGEHVNRSRKYSFL